MNDPRTVSLDAIQRLADRMAWFQSSGFVVTGRMTKFIRDLLTEANSANCDPIVLFSRIMGASLVIMEDNRKSALASQASAARNRRKAS